MENSPYLFMGVLGFYFCMAFIISSIMRNKPREDPRGTSLEEPELTDSFYVGGYLGGLTGEEVQAPFVCCKITREHFVFCRGLQGTEVGRVPRNSVTKVCIAPLSRLPQIMSAEFVPVKINKSKANVYCLVISWRDSGGGQHEAVFQFCGGSSEAEAAEAADELSFWSREKFFTRFTDEGRGLKKIACENT